MYSLIYQFILRCIVCWTVSYNIAENKHNCPLTHLRLVRCHVLLLSSSGTQDVKMQHLHLHGVRCKKLYRKYLWNCCSDEFSGSTNYWASALCIGSAVNAGGLFAYASLIKPVDHSPFLFTVMAKGSAMLPVHDFSQYQSNIIRIHVLYAQTRSCNWLCYWIKLSRPLLLLAWGLVPCSVTPHTVCV